MQYIWYNQGWCEEEIGGKEAVEGKVKWRMRQLNETRRKRETTKLKKKGQEEKNE
jgi:hypothetical protein